MHAGLARDGFVIVQRALPPRRAAWYRPRIEVLPGLPVFRLRNAEFAKMLPMFAKFGRACSRLFEADFTESGFGCRWS